MIAATACMEKAVAKKNADGKLKREYSSKLGQWYMHESPDECSASLIASPGYVQVHAVKSA